MNPLAFRGVSFGYGSGVVLHDLDLALEAGEVTAILGPNGCGKTTWVRLAAGYLRPARGRVFLQGRPVESYTPAQRARVTAWVPQDTPVAFPFTAGEVVRMGRAPYARGFGWLSAEDHRIACEAMEALQVVHLEHRPFPTLSAGERQRVVLARALAQQPRVLLLDEPAAHLDLKHTLVLHASIRDLARREGLTVALVSHDLSLTARFADRLVLLGRGRIVAQGPPGQVLTRGTVRRVYGVEAEVRDDPVLGGPWVVPLRPAPEDADGESGSGGPGRSGESG